MSAREFVEEHIKIVTRAAAALLVLLSLAVRFAFLPGALAFLPDFLRWSIPDALMFSAFLIILEQLVSLRQTLRKELAQGQGFSRYERREDAYEEVCQLLKARGHKTQRIDLLQFSGATAIKVLKEIAKSSPAAKVRLLLADYSMAEQFDAPGWHSTRIRNTLGEVRILKEADPNLRVEIGSYQTEPGISGIVVDDWLVSAGWYQVRPKPGGTRSIIGHAKPAIVAYGDAANPLLEMVLEQFEAVRSFAAPLELPEIDRQL